MDKVNRGEYVGVIEKIDKVQSFNDGKFRKQTMVLTEDVGYKGKYPCHIPFEFKNDMIDSVEGFSKGDRVKIEFVVDGRKWTDKNGVDKFFPSIVVTKISRLKDEGNNHQDTNDNSDYPF